MKKLILILCLFLLAGCDRLTSGGKTGPSPDDDIPRVSNASWKRGMGPFELACHPSPPGGKPVKEWNHKAYLKQIAEYDLNYIRIFTYCKWEWTSWPPPYDRIEDVVRLATDAGMTVQVVVFLNDKHDDGYMQDRAGHMDQLVNRLKKYPNVLWGLMNESREDVDWVADALQARGIPRSKMVVNPDNNDEDQMGKLGVGYMEFHGSRREDVELCGPQYIYDSDGGRPYDYDWLMDLAKKVHGCGGVWFHQIDNEYAMKDWERDLARDIGGLK